MTQSPLPLPGVSACDYCGGGTTRTQRPGYLVVYCSSRCRQHAHRWRRFGAVPRPPQPDSSLWSTCPRRSVDQRAPRPRFAQVAAGRLELGTVPELRPELAAIVRAVTDACRSGSGQCELVWSVSTVSVE